MCRGRRLAVTGRLAVAGGEGEIVRGCCLDPQVWLHIECGPELGREQMTSSVRVEELVSAGGVVFRNNGNGPEVVLCGKWMPRRLWALPKGTPEREETREQTALREVNEETGLEVRTQCFIDSIQYWFVRPQDGVRCHKTVLYYLMDSVGGDTSLHDNEFDEVRWFSVDDALKTMSYGNEAEVVKKGLTMALRG